MTFTQYRSGYNNSYSSASNTYLNNNIPLFKDYVQFRSADDQYVLIVGDTEDCINFTDVTVYSVNGTSGNYTIDISEYDEVTASYSNDYYTFNSFTNPYYTQYQRNQALSDSVQGFALTGGLAICVVLIFLSRLFSRVRS